MGPVLQQLAEGFSCYLSEKGLGEARLVYDEIYRDHCYDIAELSEAPVLIDAGANIGLFSLYMKQKYPLSKIIAFEPAPESFDALRQNLELHKAADGVTTYQYGLGTKADTLSITYYPTSPANTTFYPETKELQKTACTEVLGPEFTEQFYGNDVQLPVKVDRLSHFLDTYHSDVTKIDLLKIDVEGAELDVIGGIDDAHWDKVQNIVVEAANRQGEVAKIEQLLQSKGFEVATKTNPLKMAEAEKLLQSWGFKVNHVESGDERFAELLLSLIVGRRPAA